MAGLGSDIQHLEGDKSAGHWGLLGRAGASFPCKGWRGGVCHTTWGELCLGSVHGAKNQWGSGAASPGARGALLLSRPGSRPPLAPAHCARLPLFAPRCPGRSPALPSCPRFEGCPAQMAGTFRLSEAGCFPPRDSGPGSVFTQGEQSTHGFLQELLQGVDPLAVSSLPLDDNAVAAGGLSEQRGQASAAGGRGSPLLSELTQNGEGGTSGPRGPEPSEWLCWTGVWGHRASHSSHARDRTTVWGAGPGQDSFRIPRAFPENHRFQGPLRGRTAGKIQKGLEGNPPWRARGITAAPPVQGLSVHPSISFLAGPPSPASLPHASAALTCPEAAGS